MYDTSNTFGSCIGVVSIGYLSGQFQQIMANLEQPPAQIHPSGLVMFLLYDVFMGGGGPPGLFAPAESGAHAVYNSAIAQQTWLWGLYNDATCHDSKHNVIPCYNQDVESFSHEVAEWADDPFLQNPSPCTPTGGSTLLEVGDPFNNKPLSHYYTYTGSNGLSYTLEDLVFLHYFGAAASTSYGGQTTFDGENLGYCELGP